MTWFLRKSLRLGPLRLNLSKRGLGASVGVKGARIGVDAAGKPYAAGGRYGLYFRERLGPGGVHPSGQGPEEVGAAAPVEHVAIATSSAPTAPPRPRRWWLIIALALLMGLVLGVLLARAGERARVDLFDAQGRRTGYAIVDRETGRVDFYDAGSRRTGYGRVDSSGKAERFGLDGKRQEGTALPIVPDKGRAR